MLIYEKNSTMMTVLLLQHSYISSSNKRDESHNEKEREKEGDYLFVWYMKEIWDDFKKKGQLRASPTWCFNAKKNTNGFFFKGNDDDDDRWRMAAVNGIL